MKILALDQASKTTGYAIFENGKLLAYNKFTFEDSDMGIRLMKIRNKVREIIEENNIKEVIMEDIQLQEDAKNNVVTFKILAEVFGIIHELTTEMNIPWSAVSSSTWRHTLGIKGVKRAERKLLAQDYVEKHYSVRPTEDECDAICIGTYKFKNNSPIDWS